MGASFERITFSIDKELANYIRETAKKQNMKVSKFISSILKEHLKKQRKIKSGLKLIEIVNNLDTTEEEYNSFLKSFEEERNKSDRNFEK